MAQGLLLERLLRNRCHYVANELGTWWKIGQAMMVAMAVCSFDCVAVSQDPQPKKPLLSPIRVSDDGSNFVLGQSNERFVVWGVNYDHDRTGKLLEDYWLTDWDTVIEDFREIKELGANTVRVHLQIGKFLRSPRERNQESFEQLSKVVKLAEDQSLYLNITGLGCYHKHDVPMWYDELGEAARWDAQAFFWESVAETCARSPAIFCYDLMNEPILPGEKEIATEWLAGEFGGKHFVQRITRNLAGRTREQVAKAWIETLVRAIRKHDGRTLVTVGVIPWAMVWPNAKPIFYSPEANEKLDFVSIHVYPETDKIDRAMHAIAVHNIGKPIVIEEMFPLKCPVEELAQFVEQSREQCDGWISFYWGETIDELGMPPSTIPKAMTKSWLERFRAMAK